MAAEGSVVMSADGSSDSWENNKTNQVRLANEFLKHNRQLSQREMG
jgi:hypothetical protein